MDRLRDREEARKQIRRPTLSATAAAGVVSPTCLSSRDIGNILRLLNNVDPIVREGAIKSLARIRGKKAEAAVISCIKDPEPCVRAAAYRGMGMMRMHEATEHIRKALADPSDLVRCAAAAALGLLGDKSGLKVILTMARPKHPLRWNALRSLNLIIRKDFPINPGGLTDALRYVQINRRRLMKS